MFTVIYTTGLMIYTCETNILKIHQLRKICHIVQFVFLGRMLIENL